MLENKKEDLISIQQQRIECLDHLYQRIAGGFHLECLVGSAYFNIPGGKFQIKSKVNINKPSLGLNFKDPKNFLRFDIYNINIPKEKRVAIANEMLDLLKTERELLTRLQESQK